MPYLPCEYEFPKPIHFPQLTKETRKSPIDVISQYLDEQKLNWSPVGRGSRIDLD
jgi:ribosome recycling factor